MEWSAMSNFPKGSQVLAKIYGFPFWIAEVLEPDGQDTYTVVLPEGSLGEFTITKSKTSETASKGLKMNKLKIFGSQK